MLDTNKKSEARREQMLAVVSHDIKNPISIIQLEAQMILKLLDSPHREDLSERLKNQAHRILKTTRRMKELISDLLDRHRVQDSLSHLNRSNQGLDKIIRDCLDYYLPLFKEKSLRIKTDLEFHDDLFIDTSKMLQAISNLLSNAIKFSPHGGVIRIGLKKSETEICFFIQDEGPGIKESDIKLIFDKYWIGGLAQGCETGLGLFICRTIIDAHGGEIHVENAPQGGALFSFSLPLPASDGLKSWIKDRKSKIVVIDDDDDLRDVICWALEQGGYSAQGYANSEDALVSLENGRHRPSLIILDFQMDNMNGIDFMIEKRQMPDKHISDCPVIMISADPEDVRGFPEKEDLKNILGKPLDLEYLMQQVSDCVVGTSL